MAHGRDVLVLRRDMHLYSRDGKGGHVLAFRELLKRNRRAGRRQQKVDCVDLRRFRDAGESPVANPQFDRARYRREGRASRHLRTMRPERKPAPTSWGVIPTAPDIHPDCSKFVAGALRHG